MVRGGEFASEWKRSFFNPILRHAAPLRNGKLCQTFFRPTYANSSSYGDRIRMSEIGAKIRNARLERVPYMLVIGQREAEEGTVAVRHRDKDDLGAKPLADFIAEITAEIASRSL